MNARNHLTHLHFPWEVRTLQDSVSYCNRCGLCAPVCPTYEKLRQEKFSPRGRNQLLRLLLEGKLKLRAVRREAAPMVRSCCLCGKCTQACPGKIPTAEHVLELRRMLKLRLLPFTLQTVLRWRENKPLLFRLTVHTGRWLHWAGLLRWGSIVPGFRWLKHTCELLPAQRPLHFKPDECTNPTCIYLPSLEAEFFQPELAQRIYQTAQKKYRVAVWPNTPSGLFEYLYGDIRQARKQLRRLITRHGQAGALPLLTDSIDVYQFLKKAPQLFEGFAQWKTKAAQFASRVQFVTDLWPKTLQHNACPGPVYWMPCALFDSGAQPLPQIAQRLHTLFKKNLIQCDYRDVAVAPAAYGFISAQRAQDQALQAVEVLAKHQVQTVFVPSGLAALELQAYANLFYPSVRVCHLAQLEG